MYRFSIKIQAVSTSREPDMKYEILIGEAATNMQGF
jgi:hypothetical protein